MRCPSTALFDSLTVMQVGHLRMWEWENKQKDKRRAIARVRRPYRLNE